MLGSYYMDLHIHIGRTESGSPVKITGSKDLTFFNIAKEASLRKGIDLIGIIDCHSPSVQAEMLHRLDSGEMEEVEGGGIRYQQTTIILGSEIEIREHGMNAFHVLVYLPRLQDMQDFTVWMSRYMKNVELSSQRIRVTARELQMEVASRGGIFIPAHIFTPHKGIYGSCTERMADILDLDQIAAVELGLSADSEMADHIHELARYSFLSNSDAHSLAKIAREYNKALLGKPTFEEIKKCLYRQDGRQITANYGLNPRLGKYHRTYCAECNRILGEEPITVQRCLHCGGGKLVCGVMDRLMNIADQAESQSPAYRPPYFAQIPLEYIPGLGPKKMQLLLDHFGTEMNIIHEVPYHALTEVVGEEIATFIDQARQGLLKLDVGGGGKYGKVKNKLS